MAGPSSKWLRLFLWFVLSSVNPSCLLPFIVLYAITLSTAALAVLGKFHSAAKRGVAERERERDAGGMREGRDENMLEGCNQ